MNPATPCLPSRRTVLATPLLMIACAHAPNDSWPEGQQPLSLRLAGRAEPLRSWLYLPRGYRGSTRTWPLVVFLHGSGERGEELDRVKLHGPPKHVAQGADYPFVLCSPQLEEGRRWSPDTLHALLPALHARLRLDPRRTTATGLSLGGHGVWEWATAFPRDLAAIAPVCGFGEPDDLCRMRQVPVRAYHGDADTVVPLAAQQACVDALRACGGQVEWIVLHGVGHDAWNRAYEDPALVPWLMAQSRA
jgi:predicted peptidase